MKYSILSQILDQSARARRKYRQRVKTVISNLRNNYFKNLLKLQTNDKNDI